MPFTTLQNPEVSSSGHSLAELAGRLLPSPILDAGPAGFPGDYDLNAEARALFEETQPVPAAVLVPILTGGSELKLLFTERTASLAKHAGQISFPGGRIDPHDKNPLEAALRETREETGISAPFIEPLGYLEPYRTGTGYLITPVVAAIRPGYTLTPEPSEVASIFDVPLGFLLDAKNHRIDSRVWRGAERRFYAMPYGERYIWGATAGIIRTLYRRLNSE